MESFTVEQIREAFLKYFTGIGEVWFPKPTVRWTKDIITITGMKPFEAECYINQRCKEVTEQIFQEFLKELKNETRI